MLTYAWSRAPEVPSAAPERRGMAGATWRQTSCGCRRASRRSTASSVSAREQVGVLAGAETLADVQRRRRRASRPRECGTRRRRRASRGKTPASTQRAIDRCAVLPSSRRGTLKRSRSVELRHRAVHEHQLEVLGLLARELVVGPEARAQRAPADRRSPQRPRRAARLIMRKPSSASAKKISSLLAK